MITYEGARDLMASARSPERGKPLQNNTRLYERGEDYAVQLHSTDVVTIHANGTWTLRTGGWETVTTADRIRGYSPATYRTWLSIGGDWHVWLRPDERDPEPPTGERTIPKPFTVADPGPEPTKPENGCDAGLRSVKTTYERDYVRAAELHGREKPDIDSIFGTGYKKVPRTTRARDVLAWIAHVERELNSSIGHLYAWRCETTGIFYGEKSYSYHDDRWSEFIGREKFSYSAPSAHGIFKYEQCPHCKAFDAVHARWNRQMSYTGHDGIGGSKGYSQMCEWLEHFDGSREAWQEAYITEFREVRELSKAHKAWVDRNLVSWSGEVTIDSDGVLTKQCSDRHRKAMREAAKADREYNRLKRRQQREHEARERERRQLERFKTRVRKRHGQPVKEVAREAAVALANLRVALEVGATNELQSGETDGAA